MNPYQNSRSLWLGVLILTLCSCGYFAAAIFLPHTRLFDRLLPILGGNLVGFSVARIAQILYSTELPNSTRWCAGLCICVLVTVLIASVPWVIGRADDGLGTVHAQELWKDSGIDKQKAIADLLASLSNLQPNPSTQIKFLFRQVGKQHNNLSLTYVSLDSLAKLRDEYCDTMESIRKKVLLVIGEDSTDAAYEKAYYLWTYPKLMDSGFGWRFTFNRPPLWDIENTTRLLSGIRSS